MTVSNPLKTIDKTIMKCDEQATVTIGFDSSSELIARPADIVLAVDVSGSMKGEKLEYTKAGMKNLIDIISKASGDQTGEFIKNNSRIAIVKFANKGYKAIDLTSSVSSLNNIIDNLVADGLTNHFEAFYESDKILNNSSDNDKIIVLFTDGITSIGPSPDTMVNTIKGKGIEIFCIGALTDSENINKWASLPTNTHALYTTDPQELNELFEKIAYEIIKAGAKDVVITETVNSKFKIENVNNPTHGTYTLLNPQTVEWKMDGAGLTENASESLNFDISYLGTESATLDVNQSITYTDRDSNTLSFPNPSITVECTQPIIIPEKCPPKTEFVIEGCNDYKVITLEDNYVQDLGRMVRFDVPIKNVCPNKRLAIGLLLTEVDNNGIEYKRGFKTILVDAIESTKCENILIKCVNFVLPEELDVTGKTNAMCNPRNFKVQTFTNYIDTDFECCNITTV